MLIHPSRFLGFTMPNQFLLASVFDCEQFVNCTTGARPPIADQALHRKPGKPFMERSFSNQHSPALIRFGILLWAQHPCLFPRGLVRSSGIKTFPVSCSQQGDCARIPFPCEGSRGKLGLPDSGRGHHKWPRPFVKSENRYHLPTRGK